MISSSQQRVEARGGWGFSALSTDGRGVVYLVLGLRILIGSLFHGETSSARSPVLSTSACQTIGTRQRRAPLCGALRTLSSFNVGDAWHSGSKRAGLNLGQKLLCILLHPQH